MHASLSLSFSIPDEDALEFAGLPAKTRDRVRWLLSVMRAIYSAKGKVRACKNIAAAEHVHFNTIYQPWNKYSASGDWRVLIDRRHTSEFWLRDDSKIIDLPHPFIQFWKSLCDDNQRAFKPAHRSLMLRLDRWRAGDHNAAIPGYARPPVNRAGSMYPNGWTYSNLLHYKPGDVELTAARQGRTAALSLLPGIHTTRVGTYPFAEIQFDDMWHDFEVNAPNQKQSCRLLEFNAADHHSCFIFRPGLKPRLKKQADGKRQYLDGRDFHLFLVNWLLDYGVHPNGTVFNVENGTASISKAFEEKLLHIFGGRLTVMRSGMSGAAAYTGAYRERAKGNFRVKAIKEGAGKLIHNQLASLPGQVGMHRQNLPGHHEGRSRENEALLFLQAAVPALAGKLQLGFLDLSEAVIAVNQAYDLLNIRTDHQIEGWEECGYVVDEFRASPEVGGWLPMDHFLSECDEATRLLLHHQMRLDPSIRRRRNLSPAEVIAQHCSCLIKPNEAVIPDLLGDEYMELRQVREGMITFTRPEFPQKLRFKAIYQDSSGFRRRVDNGTDVITHFNPWKPDWLYLTETKSRRYLGKAERDHAATRGDVETIQRQYGKVMADYAAATRELAAREGLKRIPFIKNNTAAIRSASRPTARDTALASANLDPSSMLDADDSDLDYNAPDPAIAFDPADLL